MRQDQTPTSVLISRAQSAAADRNDEDDSKAERYWNPVRVLHCRADDEVIVAARELITSSDPESRSLGANILSQVGFGDESKAPQAAEILVTALRHETEPAVLEDLIYALGHTPDDRAAPRLIELAGHSSSDVREAVAYALPMHQDAARVISTLVALTKDSEREVRDWATFGLGSQIEADSPAIRDALVAALEDPAPDVRGEAMVGLARRGDVRVAQKISFEVERVQSEGLEVSHLLNDAAEHAINAAKLFPARGWLSLLERLKRCEMGDAKAIDEAMEACTLK